MSQEPRIVIHFNDLPSDDSLREHVESRCQHLATEFPETHHYEIHMSGDPESADSKGHVSGKRTRADASVQGATNPRHAADQVIDKLERELRRDHDKRIFGPRREAQKARSKRSV